jgi:hypothetical protein
MRSTQAREQAGGPPPSAHGMGWAAAVIATGAWAGGLAPTILIRALAGLLPAICAARLSLGQALWSLSPLPGGQPQQAQPPTLEDGHDEGHEKHG